MAFSQDVDGEPLKTRAVSSGDDDWRQIFAHVYSRDGLHGYCISRQRMTQPATIASILKGSAASFGILRIRSTRLSV